MATGKVDATKGRTKGRNGFGRVTNETDSLIIPADLNRVDIDMHDSRRIWNLPPIVCSVLIGSRTDQDYQVRLLNQWQGMTPSERGPVNDPRTPADKG